ncbi:hypothetical protein [Solicola sp. PLA-1-18]|uniref:hypothetical protein n=1 Tax=Solicola sp. PLA-1-18 TaxID=3380532 RepID=UPI003B81BE52
MSQFKIPVKADHHPLWCDLTDWCSGDHNPRHLGRRSAWSVQADDVTLELRMARNDDGVPDQRLYAGEQRAVLGIHNTACVHPDGKAVFAEVDLNPNDARTLAERLLRYADACEAIYTDVDRRDIQIDGLGGAA